MNASDDKLARDLQREILGPNVRSFPCGCVRKTKMHYPKRPWVYLPADDHSTRVECGNLEHKVVGWVHKSTCERVGLVELEAAWRVLRVPKFWAPPPPATSVGLMDERDTAVLVSWLGIEYYIDAYGQYTYADRPHSAIQVAPDWPPKMGEMFRCLTKK